MVEIFGPYALEALSRRADAKKTRLFGNRGGGDPDLFVHEKGVTGERFFAEAKERDGITPRRGNLPDDYGGGLGGQSFQIRKRFRQGNDVSVLLVKVEEVCLQHPRRPVHNALAHDQRADVPHEGICRRGPHTPA